MKIKPVQNKRALLLPVAAAMVAGLTSCDRQQVPGSVPNDRPLPPGPPKEAPRQQPRGGVRALPKEAFWQQPRGGVRALPKEAFWQRPLPTPPGPPKEAPWQQPLRGEPVQPTPPAPPKDEP